MNVLNMKKVILVIKDGMVSIFFRYESFDKISLE